VDKKLFEELTQSIKEAGEIVRGKRKPAKKTRVEPLNVKTVREKTGLPQTRFAVLMGVSIKTLQNWEQGRRRPQGPAVSLLRIVKNDPRSALKALHA
jgi:putative transcriptional regulator